MGMFDEFKSIANTLLKLGNRELYQQVLDLQAQALALAQQNAELREENTSLKKKLAIRGNLHFQHDCYWLSRKNEQSEGPFCSNCWDSQQKLVRLHSQPNPEYMICPNCTVAIKLLHRR